MLAPVCARKRGVIHDLDQPNSCTRAKRSAACYNCSAMNIRRFLVILLLMLLPVQVTLAAADSCCLAAKVTQASEHAAAVTDEGSDDGSCCTSCDFCHHSHAPFVAVVGEARPQAVSIAPVQPPEPPIYSFIPDLPPRPNWLL